jgi:luciferase-like monooxygenase
VPESSLSEVSEAVKDRLLEEVASWEGVSTGPGRFGSTRFLVGQRELGHLHGSSTLDMPLPPSLKRELIERGEARMHRWTPEESCWVTIVVGEDADIERAIELLRERYEHATEDRATAERG